MVSFSFEKIKLPIKFGILPIFGDGKQPFAWIHIDDLIAIFMYSIINKNYIGPYNAVAPINNTYLELNTKIAELLGRKVIQIKIPNFLLKLIFGELSKTLTSGKQIAVEKLINSGFNFKFKNLNTALSNLLIENK